MGPEYLRVVPESSDKVFQLAIDGVSDGLPGTVARAKDNKFSA